METIKPYIDAGWWTVPILGNLKRREDGTKTEPKFTCKGWKKKFSEERNTKATKLGGVLTGEKSNLVAIDCDNELTFNMFKALDPTNKAIFMSVGKGKVCGTFLYKFDPRIPTFATKKNGLELDYYAESGFIYLASEANHTKEVWTEVPEIPEMPEVVFATLLHIQQSQEQKPASQSSDLGEERANFLAPIVEDFVSKGEFLPILFKIITPKAFRDEEQYVKKGYLHPNNVPEGAGSTYLSKISCILGSDPSIDETLYVEAMHAINNLWDSPMPAERLDKTICDRMLEKAVKINGEVVWAYDKNWQQRRLSLRTKRQTLVEIIYDDNRRTYYVVDLINEKVSPFQSDNELQGHLDTILVQAMTKKELKAKMPLANVMANPSREFGFLESKDVSVRDFNNFKHTPELKIINDPDSYAKHYTEPTLTLEYFRTLVPEDRMRNWLYGFMKRKLTTFKYSPAVLFFIGVHGSGKDTFVELLERIIPNVSRPKASEFIEKHNGWLMDSYFVQLDEYGNQLATAREKDAALGLIKAYSGKRAVSIRTMRNDSTPYLHNATFIMTQNKQPLTFEDGERRMAFLNTPNVLNKQQWVIENGGVVAVRDRILEHELKDFCYYLATQAPEITTDEYVNPPYSDHKHKIIADSMYAAQRIAYAIKHQMQEYLVELAIEYECRDVADAFRDANVYTSQLEDLYGELTEYKGENRALMKTLRSNGIAIAPSTKGGNNDYKVKLNWGSPKLFNDKDDEDYGAF